MRFFIDAVWRNWPLWYMITIIWERFTYIQIFYYWMYIYIYIEQVAAQSSIHAYTRLANRLLGWVEYIEIISVNTTSSVMKFAEGLVTNVCNLLPLSLSLSLFLLPSILSSNASHYRYTPPILLVLPAVNFVSPSELLQVIFAENRFNSNLGTRICSSLIHFTIKLFYKLSLTVRLL